MEGQERPRKQTFCVDGVPHALQANTKKTDGELIRLFFCKGIGHDRTSGSILFPTRSRHARWTRSTIRMKRTIQHFCISICSIGKTRVDSVPKRCFRMHYVLVLVLYCHCHVRGVFFLYALFWTFGDLAKRGSVCFGCHEHRSTSERWLVVATAYKKLFLRLSVQPDKRTMHNQW